jgi:hypothetical protein
VTWRGRTTARSERRSCSEPCANKFIHAHAGTLAARPSIRSATCPTRNASQSPISSALRAFRSRYHK